MKPTLCEPLAAFKHILIKKINDNSHLSTLQVIRENVHSIAAACNCDVELKEGKEYQYGVKVTAISRDFAQKWSCKF